MSEQRLSETEREALADACDAMYDFGETWVRFLRNGDEDVLLPAVEAILTARLANVRAAEAEAHNLAHEVDRVRGRLWRLAALAGWRPGNPADNDATAELYVTDALRAALSGDSEDQARAVYCLRCEVPIYDDHGVWRRLSTGVARCPRNPAGDGHEPLSGDPGPEGCPTPGCPGDVRYAAPGRAHLAECHYPIDPGPEGSAG